MPWPRSSVTQFPHSRWIGRKVVWILYNFILNSKPLYLAFQIKQISKNLKLKPSLINIVSLWITHTMKEWKKPIDSFSFDLVIKKNMGKANCRRDDLANRQVG
jgi:hypothetical protein